MPDALEPATRRALSLGRELFIAGRYFDAHEAWEAAWRVESGHVRALLQGLIQVAAGYVKATRDRRPAGALKLLQAASRRLEPLPDPCAGIALGPFRAGLAHAIEAARRWSEGSASRFEAPPPPVDLADPT